MTKLYETKKRNLARNRRHSRVRKKVKGTQERPRLCIFRSSNHIYAQVVNDLESVVICSASTMAKQYKDLKIKGHSGNCKAAEGVGKLIAQNAKAKGVDKVVFDKGGFKYHGRVKALADASRSEGLKF